MNLQTILDVFRKVGIAGRKGMNFADNYSRVYEISTIIKVTVKTGDGSSVPEGVTALDGEFVFDLNHETTNATPEEVKEIQRWVDIREIPELKAAVEISK